MTLVRNEKNHKVFDAIKGIKFEINLTDEDPVTDDESRYYVRVEQTDGNMAWSSPVWVTVKNVAKK